MLFRSVHFFLTRFWQVGFGLGTNPTQTDPWTALNTSVEPRTESKVLFQCHYHLCYSVTYPSFPVSCKIKALFGSCKSIFGKYFIFCKCYFSERKMFSCVWLHFKKCFEKYFLVFSCVLENTIENIFSICCSHFLSCQTNI